MAENRFLQSFCAVAASSVLVSGTLFLLTTTAPWTPPPLGSEPRTEGTPVSITAAASDAEARSPLASDQAELGPEIDALDRTFTAATDKVPDLAREHSNDPSSPDEEAVAALGTPLNPDMADRRNDVAEETQSSDQETLEARPQIAANSAPEPQDPSAGEINQGAVAQFAEVMAGLPPRVITAERSEAATDQIADVLAALPPAPPPPPAIKVAAVMSDTSPVASIDEKIEVSDLKVAALTATTPAARPVVEVTAVVTPPPPLPRRKPEAPPAPQLAAAQPAPEAPPAPKIAAQPAPDMPPAPKAAVVATQQRERPAVQPAPQQQTARPGGLFGNWKPMALAPADEPAPAASRPPTARPSSSAYASQVWARLARHKPRARQRGSASVAFAIGAGGSLGAVRIARSSGNARIDRLALATVRNAAPFPAPPSGAVSYTIRIDFQ